MKIMTILILIIGVFCFYVAYQKFQLPYDSKGEFLSSSGEVMKKSSAVKILIMGVLAFLFALIWNVLFKKISKK